MSEPVVLRRYFHQQLEDLKLLLLEMGGLVQDQLRRAAQALLEADHAKARHVIALDREVDHFELRVDEACVRLLALHQPAAVDLRFVAASMKVVTELERIGDQAVNIARRALAPASPVLVRESGLAAMVALARGMISDSLDALAREDTTLARRVIERDPALDSLEQHIVRILLGDAGRDPALLPDVFRLAYAARSLERIADHATNIAEMVIYTGDGVVERHTAADSQARRATG